MKLWKGQPQIFLQKFHKCKTTLLVSPDKIIDRFLNPECILLCLHIMIFHNKKPNIFLKYFDLYHILGRPFAHASGYSIFLPRNKIDVL